MPKLNLLAYPASLFSASKRKTKRFYANAWTTSSVYLLRLDHGTSSTLYTTQHWIDEYLFCPPDVHLFAENRVNYRLTNDALTTFTSGSNLQLVQGKPFQLVDGYIYKSLDQGISWTPLPNNHQPEKFFRFHILNNRIFAEGAGLWITNDQGNVWAPVSTPNLGVEGSVEGILLHDDYLYLKTGDGFAVGYNGIFSQRLGSSHWSQTTTGFEWLISDLVIQGNTIFAADSAGNVFANRNDSLNWVKVLGKTEWNAQRTFCLATDQEFHLYLGTEHGVYRYSPLSNVHDFCAYQ